MAQQVEGVETVVEGSTVDEARGMVERGFFALYTEPRAQAQVDKWVRVLEGSGLPHDRKTVLVEKLVSDQEAALAAQAAAERWFGGPGVDAVAAGLAALDTVWDGLAEQGPSSEKQPEALIEELAGNDASAVVGFCSEVYLILGFLDEEEEEEALDGDVPLPEQA